MSNLILFLVLNFLVLGLAVDFKYAQNLTYFFDSQLPPRLQWLSNDGYCGGIII